MNKLVKMHGINSVKIGKFISSFILFLLAIFFPEISTRPVQVWAFVNCGYLPIRDLVRAVTFIAVF